MLENSALEHKVTYNFINVKLWFTIPFLLLLILIYLSVIVNSNGTNYTEEYIQIQKKLFFYMNYKMSDFPNLQFNLTQLGDALIGFPFIAVFIIYAPKLWEALLTSSIISIVVSASLKKLFAVPRPAAFFDQSEFTIVGVPLTGYSSLPSGHSICTFIVITLILFAFMPKKNKIVWTTFIILLGLIVAFSRVAVGAHYPLDVIIGSAIGFIVAIISIKLSNHLTLFAWIKNKKYYPIYILIFTIWGILIVKKIVQMNLPVFYISLIPILITLYLMTRFYVRKNK